MIRVLSIGVALGALAAGTAAQAQSRRLTATPYIELGQVLDADLNSGDVLTYSNVAVGIDVAASSARVNGQLSYRYERRIAWDDDIGDSDIHTGLARVSAQVARGLMLEAGGIATRTRSDIRGAAPGVLVGNVDNISQVYAVYGGPSYATHAGPVAVAASYQAGYTKVQTPSFTGVAAGQPRLDYYDDSFGQVAGLSLGVQPGQVLPVGLTASGGWEREDAGQLDGRYEAWRARGDVLAPVSANVALTAGVGYERVETSSRSALLTAAGAPVVDGDGRFVTDEASPRQIAYRTDGVYYDAGVVWRPNRRVSAEAHVGKRYGTVSYTGLVTYQASEHVGFSADVYDSVTTFGRQLRTGLSQLPTSFIAARDAFTQQFNGCVFSTSGSTPGGCLNDVFQSISTASYRARGADAVLSITRGRSSYGGGIGYANRKLFNRDTVPGVTLYGIEDQSAYGQLFWNRTLTPASTVDLNAFVNYYESGVAQAAGVWSYGGTASYGHSFGRVTTSASAGVYAFDTGDVDTSWSAQAILAARYSF
ncbi:hypothetical protein M9979_06125 [Sphingomonas sp. RP10(2022)]|uniref:Preprotein translocase subunit YajC n=1 Tax=Sphingomonas liriopis TaxID=2949094 RepID=A0A9X2HNW5_9SPHN|nr:hypothetical protein [Sphingomonas liriopis]MCP3734453.1 hypothetical protein [Sphingomonas liriopis]